MARRGHPAGLRLSIQWFVFKSFEVIQAGQKMIGKQVTGKMRSATNKSFQVQYHVTLVGHVKRLRVEWLIIVI